MSEHSTATPEGARSSAARRVQTKLRVSEPGDAQEREADRAAARIVGGQSRARSGKQPDERRPAAQRAVSDERRPASVSRKADQKKPQAAQRKADEKKPAPVQRKADEKKPQVAQRKTDERKPQAVQRKADEKKPAAVQRAPAEQRKPGAPAVQREAKAGPPASDADTLAETAETAVAEKGPGRPLDESVRVPLEEGLGADFSAVRVHDDVQARARAAALHARAFTHGSDIWLGPGESSLDLALMAHEAAHVVQQGGAGRGVVQRQASGDPDKDLQTFQLPKVKARHKPVYEAWAKGGALKRQAKYQRGSPEQREKVWKKEMADKIAEEPLSKLGIKKDVPVLRGISIHGKPRNLPKTYEKARKELTIPDWDKDGKACDFEVDHIVELQVGGWPGATQANTLENMELLDKSSNASAGSATRLSIRDNVEKYLKATGVKPSDAKIDSHLSKNAVDFSAVELMSTGDKTDAKSKFWTRKDIESGAHLAKATCAVINEQGTAESFVLMSRGGAVLGAFPHENDPNKIVIPEKSALSAKVAGLKISQIKLNSGYESLADGKEMGSVRAKLDLPEKFEAPEKAFDITLLKSKGFAGFFDDLADLPDATFKGMSPLKFGTVGVDTEGLSARAELRPSLPLLADTAIVVSVTGKDVEFSYQFGTGDISLPIPGVSVDDVTLGVRFGTRGFHVEGAVAFGVEKLGRGVLKAGIDGKGNFEALGQFSFDTELFDEASVQVWYRDHAFGGAGTLRITKPGKVKGIKQGEITASFHEKDFAAKGNVIPDVPGVDSAALELSHTEAEGLIIAGNMTLGKVPGIKSGALTARVQQKPGAKDYSVSARGTAAPSIPGIDSSLNIAYDDGALTIEGSANYARGMLSGSLAVGVTNRVLDAAGQPTAALSDKLKVYGGGTLTARLAPWLQGTAGVRFLQNGEIELTGRIALPSALQLFPGKSLKRNIFSLNLDIPILGFAVAGQRVGIFATIGGGLDLTAGVGPGELRELGLDVTYNPAHEDQTHVHGGAKLVIPAHAGLRLFIRGALGVGIPIVSAELGLEVGASLGLEGAVEAAVDVDWTPTQGITLDALGSIYVQPKFRFDLTGFLKVIADLWITTIDLYEKRWELAAFELGPDLRLGLRLPIHYQEGQPFDISWDQVEFDVPNVDTNALLGDVIDKIV